MILVDTSVLIDYLRGNENNAIQKFQQILDHNIPFGINSFIYQEVLQGVKSEKDFQTVKEYLDTQHFYSLKDQKESFAAAAKIYFTCRKKGITIQSTIDCLIIQTALENDLFLLHNDADFDRTAKIVGLKVF
ncbi:MAG: PIN domain nuclease [Nitrospiraceae bacterium]|nr:PIN domain nuclease [Nitrospiraceae bacterium]